MLQFDEARLFRIDVTVRSARTLLYAIEVVSGRADNLESIADILASSGHADQN